MNKTTTANKFSSLTFSCPIQAALDEISRALPGTRVGF